MTVLVDARPLSVRNPGGVTKVTEGLLPALFRAMPEHHFVLATTGWSRPHLEHLTNSRVEHRHFFCPNKIWNLACFLRLISLDRAFHDLKADLLFLTNIGWIGRPRIPYALLAHDISFLIEPRWFGWKDRIRHHATEATFLIKNAAQIFSISERTKQDLIQFLNLPAERMTVIPLGWTNPTHAFDDLPPQLIGKRYVLALGANNRRKNTGCVLAAVNALRQYPKFKDIMLVVVGASRPKLLSTFYFLLSHPSDRALTTLMKHASAFLYPSWYEGFGLPLHEAARFGTPCIASTAGALPETAPQGTLFAPPSKPHLWTQALEMILDQPEAHRTSTILGDWTAAAETIKTRISI